MSDPHQHAIRPMQPLMQGMPGMPPLQGGPQMMYPGMPPPRHQMPGMPMGMHMMPGVVPPPPRLPKRPPPTEPCQTLYVRNLSETRALKGLITALNAVFTPFGEIISLRVKRNIKLRGQAFVTFKEVDSATKALKEIQGFPLFQRPMDIQYARDASYKATEMKGGKEAVEEQKRKRIEDDRNREAKQAKVDATAVAAVYGPGYYYGGAAVPEELLPPNNILFVQNLPTETTESILTALFKQINGFKEVRLVPGKSDIAFVEYESEAQASSARQSLNKYKITPEREITVTFAKK